MKKVTLSKLKLRLKKGEKGRTVVYNILGMADYLLPESNLSVSEKVKSFALIYEMNDNPCSFGDKIKCPIGSSRNFFHQHFFSSIFFFYPKKISPKNFFLQTNIFNKKIVHQKTFFTKKHCKPKNFFHPKTFS